MAETTVGARHWSMSPRVRVLAAVNAGLALAIAGVALGPTATAQDDVAARRPQGDYTIVGGQDRAQNVNLVYVVDATNEEMITLQWDDSRRVLRGVGFRSLKDDVQRKGNR